MEDKFLGEPVSFWYGVRRYYTERPSEKQLISRLIILEGRLKLLQDLLNRSVDLANISEVE